MTHEEGLARFASRAHGYRYRAPAIDLPVDDRAANLEDRRRCAWEWFLRTEDATQRAIAWYRIERAKRPWLHDVLGLLTREEWNEVRPLTEQRCPKCGGRSAIPSTVRPQRKRAIVRLTHGVACADCGYRWRSRLGAWLGSRQVEVRG